MAKRARANVRLSEVDIAILDNAAQLWPQDAGNRSELIRRVLWQWWISREENGGKTTQVLSRIDQAQKEIQADTHRILEILESED